MRGDPIITLVDLQTRRKRSCAWWRKADEGFDVVGTVRQNRQDSLFRKSASKSYPLIQRTTGKARL